jgi:G:T/U-mismatch repair DNA glycosylase
MGIKRKDKKNAKSQVAADNAYYAERGEEARIENSKRMVIIKAKYNKLPADKQKTVKAIAEEYRQQKPKRYEDRINKTKLLFIVCILTVVFGILFGAKLYRKLKKLKAEQKNFAAAYVNKNDFDDLLRTAYYDDDKFKRQMELRVLIEEGKY